MIYWYLRSSQIAKNCFEMKSVFYALLILLCFQSCFPDPFVVPSSKDEGRAIKDSYGRTLILHGLNTASGAKNAPDNQPWIDEAHVERETTWGFNVVRYLIFWEGVEPEKGFFDEEYLDMVEEKINWYTSRGIYVLFDMHQDLYGPAVGGNGAPDWAVETDGLVPDLDAQYDAWWLRYLDPAVIRAVQNFWKYTTYKDLQDHYILAWQAVVERFKDNPYVIGYDLMNEPHGGDLVITIGNDFEAVQLQNFYSRLIPGIRAIDNEKYIFFEPQSFGINFGLQSSLAKVSDARVGEEKLVYAPHCYPLLLHEGEAYQPFDKVNLRHWAKARSIEQDRHDTPMFIGEFGVSPHAGGFNDYLNDFHTIADSLCASWTYWSNDLGGWSPLDANQNETPILNPLIRAYPQATAGILKSYTYDDEAKIFEMTFMNDPSIAAPTEIFVPLRHYVNGWELEVRGVEQYSKTWDVGRQVLSFTSREDKIISLKISMPAQKQY